MASLNGSPRVPTQQPFPGLLRRISSSGSSPTPGPGRVRDLVGMFQNNRDEPMGITARHGTAERGRFRQRSRDRGSSAPPRPFDESTRFQPAGSQETIDWLSALESYDNRMNTVKRQLRMQAQSLATLEEQRGRMQEAMTQHHREFIQYKEFVQGTFTKIDAYVNKRADALQTTLDTTVNDNFNLLAEKLQIIEASYNSLLEHMSSFRKTVLSTGGGPKIVKG